MDWKYFFKRIGIGVGVVFLIFVVAWVNAFVYPFRSVKPNYSDVEKVFARLQVPSSWKMIEHSENRGMFGRGCPIESSSVCFHKSATYTVPANVSDDVVKNVYKSLGCSAVASRDNSPVGGDSYTNFECTTDGLKVTGDTIRKSEGWTVSVIVSTN